MADDIENERINLLVCKTCKTIEEIPYTKTGEYLGEGKYKQDDNPFVQLAADKHGPNHIGAPLMDILFAIWMTKDLKEQVIGQIREQILGGNTNSGLDVFGTGFYGLKDTYSSDAMSCWAVHNKPKGQCDEYKADRKKLSAGTDAERKAAGVAPSDIKVFLCDFCPVKMYNQQKAYKARGLYE